MRDRPTPDLPPPGLLPAALARLLPVGCRHVAAFIEAGPAADADDGMPDARAFKDWCAAGKAGVALLDALVRLSQRVAPETVPLPDSPSPDGPSPDGPPEDPPPDTPAAPPAPAAGGPEQPGGLAGLMADSRAEVAAWRARRAGPLPADPAEPAEPAPTAPAPDPAGPDPPDTS
ncbi:hypothetical protein [Rhodospirillum centenum]|uniref:Uncharacterized protein n=1 Tax=Rhodospirillum centenum (strain ATCC 51521 / SW) TaxID=414684 RepID=B6IVZ9_RHOCS|nr:hypothetical protein [Rhodospirillum centenum]ACJ00473.1 hypothetical protein RC1_3108 [Rhodospirillum centenum SW]